MNYYQIYSIMKELSMKFGFCLIGCGILVVCLRLNLLQEADSCRGLLKSGRYRGDDLIWQPDGCLMHQYTTVESHQCFRSLSALQRGAGYHILFIGDSRVRQQFRQLEALLTGVKKLLAPGDKHKDIHFTHPPTNTTFTFLWKPLPAQILAFFHSWHTVTSQPQVLFIGFAMHHLKSNSRRLDKTGTISTYQYYVTKMAEFFRKTSNITYIWMMQDPIHEEHFKIRVEKYKEKVFVSNRLIQIINEKAAHVLDNTAVNIWRSNTLVSLPFLHQTKHLDGVHIADAALERDVQILVNFLCNEVYRPADGTCCRSKHHHR